MLEGIYIIIAIFAFFAQLKNGFLTAILTAIFWPIVVVGLSLFPIFLSIRNDLKNK